MVGEGVLGVPSRHLYDRLEARGLCAKSDDSAYTDSLDWWRLPADERRSAAAWWARTLCDGCPVMAECVVVALRASESSGYVQHGTWGGLAMWELTELAAKRRAERQASAGQRSGCAA